MEDLDELDVWIECLNQAAEPVRTNAGQEDVGLNRPAHVAETETVERPDPFREPFMVDLFPIQVEGKKSELDRGTHLLHSLNERPQVARQSTIEDRDANRRVRILAAPATDETGQPHREGANQPVRASPEIVRYQQQQ